MAHPSHAAAPPWCVFMNGKVCGNLFASKALEFVRPKDGFDITGYVARVCRCADALSFVSTPLGGAVINPLLPRVSILNQS